MHSDIIGVILAGGKSRRMGVDKSLLKINDRFVIENITDLMKNIFENVIIISNKSDYFEFLGLNIFPDIYKNKGPLAGIHSGLINSKNEKIFVISCDVPLMTKEIIDFIINYKSEKFVKVAKADGYIQQLCGLYSKYCIEQVEKILNDEIMSDVKKCSVLKLIESTESEIIDIEKHNVLKGSEFLNMNTMEDFEAVKRKFNLKVNE